MGYVANEMTFLVAQNPDEARRRIIDCYERHATMDKTAAALKCSVVTLYRWMEKLGIKLEDAPVRRIVRAS